MSEAISEAKTDILAAAPDELLEEVNVSATEAYDRGKVDINFFAGVCLPDIHVSDLPGFYIMIWQLFAVRKTEDMGKILRFALGLPRGHAKTTFIKILICWLIVYDKVTFILIICANESLSENLLSDINDILSSPNIEAIYGPWSSYLTKDTSDLKKAFYHKRPVVLAAKGAQSSLRGLNIKNHRPDLIFCDDMQTRENDESEAERNKLLRWFTATLIKVLATRGNRLIIYVGNMYSEDCILNQLQSNKHWVSLITGAILENGEPLWADIFSIADLLESFEHDEALGQGELWFAEVMNDPIAAGGGLLPLPMPVYKIEEGLETDPDGVFITVDPAGFKKSSDDNVVSLHYVIDGVSVVWERLAGADLKNPEQMVIATLTLAMEHGASIIGVEDVGYQATLAFWFTKYMTELGIQGILIVPLKPAGRTKEQRIRAFIQDCYAGNSCHHPRTRGAFVFQATKYRVGKKENKDDILDCDAYALDIRNEYWYAVHNARRMRIGAVDALAGNELTDDNTPF
jgi:hypothetical protein